MEENLPNGMGIAGAILRATLAHLYLAWIHPYGDGNGRTARLVEFTILVKAGVPTPAAHLLSNHYNETRGQYYKELDRASKSGGDIVPFVTYAVRGFIDGLRAQIEVVKNQQLDVAWKNYVYGEIPDRSESHERRRELLFALTAHGEPVLRKKIMELTPKLALAYAKKTKKTLSRDLNALREMNLTVQTRRGTKANRDLMKAFLPLRAPTNGEAT